MKKQLLVALTLLTFACLCPRATSAQLPGGLKIPKPLRPKPTPTPAEAARPAPSEEATPDAQPGAPAATTAAPAARPQPGGPKVITTRVQFRAKTVSSYKGALGVWSWVPEIKFDIEGALPSGAHYYVEVAQPGGGAWVKTDCAMGGSMYECGGQNQLPDSGTLATGLFPFAIKMRNALQGTDQTLFTGRAKVEKALASGNLPPTSKEFVYYANHDGNLPVSHVYYDDNLNLLKVKFWVRGDSVRIEPHLFYRGKEVTLQWMDQIKGGGSCSSDIQFIPTHETTEKLPQRAVWNRIDCYLQAGFVKEVTDNASVQAYHALTKNPGEYEVKVLRNGRLSRSIKFAVGPDGNLVDNGVAASVGLAGPGFVMVPVAILDDQDGPWDRNAWKTDALYGNTLKGFNWPPR
jgi:hypothetical protein